MERERIKIYIVIDPSDNETMCAYLTEQEAIDEADSAGCEVGEIYLYQDKL